MEQSHFLPILNKDFYISKVIENKQFIDWFKKHYKTAQNITNLELLYQLHSHDFLEILVVLEGECEFFCEGMTYSLSKRDIAVIPPHAVHRAVIKSPDHYKRIVVNISQHLMSDFEYSSLTMKETRIYQKTRGSQVLQLDAENFQHMISLFDEMSEKIENGKEIYSFTLQYLLFQVLQIIFDPSCSSLDLSKKKVLDQRLASILEYIEVHLIDTDLSLDSVSDYFHLNKFHFSHYFKKKMNLPFYRYVLLKRLSLAVAMIKQNQLTIEQIALKCGYNDYSSFYRSFKKEYEISPKNLQKEYINNFRGD